jgi:hypothetical protein
MLRAAKITEISAKGRRTSAITVEKNFFHHQTFQEVFKEAHL